MDALDLTAGLAGAAPLWLLADGTFATAPGTPVSGLEALDALVTAARWVSTRRTRTLQDDPPGLGKDRAPALLTQLRDALAAARGDADPLASAQLRSACVTVLSHVVATALRDPSWRSLADDAAAAIFGVIADETERPALRAHATYLLQQRAPALTPADRARVLAALRTLNRAAPPYDDLRGPWRFAMCSDHEFHAGECDILVEKFDFEAVPTPVDGPKGDYSVYRAPFDNKGGEPIFLYARSAYPEDENREMGEEAFVGVLINRHAQLGAFDMRAANVQVVQRGYKLLMNSQCAGLTTRYAISRLFPDADVYSSWDSTFFRTERGGGAGKVTESEGLDCFVALLRGMAEGLDHAGLSARMRKVQWHHDGARALPDFVQFVGPSHPLVVARTSDVNHDGHADYYDGFLDFTLRAIAVEVGSAIEPRDPGVRASQIAGAAAEGLHWATGSMNRVTRYSELWKGLPGAAELAYTFRTGGFYSHVEPPHDVLGGLAGEDASRLPALCRYALASEGLDVEVHAHAWLAHTGAEQKRLFVAADAVWRAFDGGHLPDKAPFDQLFGRRAMVLLVMAGLLEYPADQNRLDAQWSAALRLLRFPDLSRSTVRSCISNADHDAGNYYGSKRGIEALEKVLHKGDPVALERLRSVDPTVGRASTLVL